MLNKMALAISARLDAIREMRSEGYRAEAIEKKEPFGAGCLSWRGIILASLAFVPFAPTHADTHQDRIQGYALIVAMTSYAEAHCEGIKVSEGALTVVGNVAGLMHEDEPLLEQASPQALRDIASAYAKIGKATWCAHAWDLFGPEGTKIPGIFERED